jgi:hypothetical protein
MKRSYKQILIRIGGVRKVERRQANSFQYGLKYRKGDLIAGLTEHGVNRRSGEETYRVFLNGRLADREFVDSFYHEMTHVLLHMFRLPVRRKTAENICGWTGYMGKVLLAERMPRRFGRKTGDEIRRGKS